MVAGKVKDATPREGFVGKGMYDDYTSGITKWNLETGTGKSFREREKALEGVAIGLDLQWVVAAAPPTVEDVQTLYPGITSDVDITIKLDETTRDYNLARTKYFWLRMGTLDIEGPTMELDQTFIDMKFKDGRMCDGPGLRLHEMDKAANRVEEDLSETRKVAYKTYFLDANNTTILLFKTDITVISHDFGTISTLALTAGRYKGQGWKLAYRRTDLCVGQLLGAI